MVVLRAGTLHMAVNYDWCDMSPEADRQLGIFCHDDQPHIFQVNIHARNKYLMILAMLCLETTSTNTETENTQNQTSSFEFHVCKKECV
jgi:hypothetical protein